jgi:phage/plasmid-like protein (TIGR03299 family)
MAHNIANLNGQDTFVYLDQPAWHKLGRNILKEIQALAPEHRLSATLAAAGMDYDVQTRPIFVAGDRLIPSHKATVRVDADGTETVLGVVGEGYKTIQNTEAIAAIRPLVEEFGCVPAAAGALGQGERAWVLLRFADKVITPLPGDDVRGYFLLYWDHAGQASLKMLGTPVRVVCQNTLGVATNGRSAWIQVRHTTNADQRLDQAAGIVRKLGESLQLTGETFTQLAHKVLNARQLAEYIERAIPNTDPKAANAAKVIQARRDTVAKLVFYGRGAALANQDVDTAAGESTPWGAYNAVTEYYDHVRPAEATNDSGLRRAYESSVFGGNAEIKQAALEVARELVAA